MDLTFPKETDGDPTVSPLWGRFKAFWLAQPESKRLLPLYASTLFVCAVGLAAILMTDGVGLGSPWAVAALAVAALYAESNTLRVSPAIEVSVTSTLIIFAAVLFGPLAAMLVGATGLMTVWREPELDSRLLRWATWTGSRAIVACLAGIAATSLQGRLTSPAVLFAAVGAASAADLVGDVLLAPLPAVIRGSAKWSEVVRNILPMQAAALPFHLPLIGLLAYAYVRISPWSVALFIVPVFAAQRLLVLYHRQRATSEELTVANERLVEANLSFASALVATVEARDEYTAGHSTAVATYARDIAAQMGLGDEDQAKAHLCGLVHDVGKVGLPPGLLQKAGALTLEERRQMEQHPIIGERILRKVESYADIARIVRHHHERVDGLGYPDRLAGDEIPLISRIIAVADAYDAMTSDRPYRDAMPSQVARMRLACAVGSQFDIAVVAAFEAVLASAEPGYTPARQSSHVRSHSTPVLSGVA